MCQILLNAIGLAVSRSFIRYASLVVVFLGTSLLILHSVKGSRVPSSDDRLVTLDLISERLIVSGKTASFSSGSPGVWLLQEGFHNPDSEGALMSQSSGLIRFSTPEREPISLTLLVSAVPLDGSPYVPVRLRSSIDVVERDLLGLETIDLALDGGPEQTVTVSCKNPGSPFLLGAGADQRRQCLRVIALDLRFEVGN